MGLLRRVESRGQGLREQLQLHQLEREALLLDAWLASKVASAESQDCGQDLEAVKVSHFQTNLGESGLRLSKGGEVFMWGGREAKVSRGEMGVSGLWEGPCGSRGGAECRWNCQVLPSPS